MPRPRWVNAAAWSGSAPRAEDREVQAGDEQRDGRQAALADDLRALRPDLLQGDLHPRARLVLRPQHEEGVVRVARVVESEQRHRAAERPGGRRSARRGPARASAARGSARAGGRRRRRRRAPRRAAGRRPARGGRSRRSAGRPWRPQPYPQGTRRCPMSATTAIGTRRPARRPPGRLAVPAARPRPRAGRLSRRRAIPTCSPRSSGCPTRVERAAPDALTGYDVVRAHGRRAGPRSRPRRTPRPRARGSTPS